MIVILAVLALLLILFRRDWNGNDLLLVGAVVGGLAVVAVLGFTLVSLLVGVALAGRRADRRRGASGDAVR